AKADQYVAAFAGNAVGLPGVVQSLARIHIQGCAELLSQRRERNVLGVQDLVFEGEVGGNSHESKYRDACPSKQWGMPRYGGVRAALALSQNNTTPGLSFGVMCGPILAGGF